MRNQICKIAAGLVAMIALLACSSQPRSQAKSVDDHGNPTVPIVAFLSSDGTQTVTFAGMVHVAPTKFYSDIVQKIITDTQSPSLTVALLEGVACSKSWFNIQRIIDTFPLKKQDLTARFSDQELRAAASGAPSQPVESFVTDYIKSWIDQNNPNDMITQESCIDHQASSGSLNQSFEDLSSKLKSDSGMEWVSQYAQASPFQKFLKSPRVSTTTTDIDSSNLDLSNPNHLLYYFFISQHDQGLTFPVDPSGIGPWEVLFGVGSGAGIKLRGAYLFDKLSSIGTQFFKHIVLPWGAGHFTDFSERFAAAGYRQISRVDVVYDDHCGESQGQEKRLCDIVGE